MLGSPAIDAIDVSGFDDLSVVPCGVLNPYLYASVDQAICDGEVRPAMDDSACDGAVDEDFITSSTTCGLGVCAGNTGLETCEGGAAIDSCDPFAGASIDGLVCDGLDNDCDGLVDENCIADCSNAVPSASLLWPPNHEFVDITVQGVFDPLDDRLSVEITGILQDEPVDTTGDGRFAPDGEGLGTNTARIRAERSGTVDVPGDGRVYHITFSVRDETGGMCTGTVNVGVPHDEMDVPVDGGPLYDATLPRED